MLVLHTTGIESHCDVYVTATLPFGIFLGAYLLTPDMQFGNNILDA